MYVVWSYTCIDWQYCQHCMRKITLGIAYRRVNSYTLRWQIALESVEYIEASSHSWHIQFRAVKYVLTRRKTFKKDPSSIEAGHRDREKMTTKKFLRKIFCRHFFLFQKDQGIFQCIESFQKIWHSLQK